MMTKDELIQSIQVGKHRTPSANATLTKALEGRLFEIAVNPEEGGLPVGMTALIGALARILWESGVALDKLNVAQRQQMAAQGIELITTQLIQHTAFNFAKEEAQAEFVAEQSNG